MKKAMKNIYILMLTLIMQSCWYPQNTIYNNYFAPDQFYLNSNSLEYDEISCLIVTDIDSVEKYSTNGFRMAPNQIVAMNSFDSYTQYRADITTKINSGDGIKFSFRTIIDEYNKIPDISFDFTPEGCFVFEKGTQIRAVDSIKVKIGEKSRILIENYGKLVNIVVDCDTVFYGPIDLPTSEQLIIKTLNNTSAELSGITLENLNSDVNFSKNAPIIIK